MKGIFLLLGTNMGDRLANLKTARMILESHEMTIVDYSSVYESAPWGDPDQDWFLNMVLRVDTIHEPEKLLGVCLAAEDQMGRKRIKRWGQRIIDIDILYYDNHVMETKELTLPHPGIPMRKFALMPMVEIADKESHPLLNLSQAELLNICPDTLECRATELDIMS
ncbi:2-amino-4-hydroxy-6-hydroxymethyldihydropteridine diphosphokinase [Marinoscillum furvescens]|uniref:2-amino-4-hydroxy-6-hydroxymethyldihydropteridine pyrophosphokinase n=1 Tax=Marinoscillum furvescens DSM 4134 TaxID=1122208 RepID=A0A3D9L0B1_MARFU|nr:2-amino-4-hydroxy-6-hydroxymethyldihydropteridine diphosphokinase [Marinoscillum furvescens]RED96617.1 2-amino-4-hydroxy-6-hydroxymethyldihydropteridine diphosphokinase [Marinoscillum furvescens DSM 4134]